MVAATDGPIGRTIAGRYLIEGVLGHGGMGDVFVARQAPLQRRVALKLIRAEYARDARLAARFEREARALAHLSDPHVVTLLDFGVTETGELFMAMELLQGETLRTRLRRLGAMETRAALEIAQQICRGLAAAHKAGVVHRDLKPENIMLTQVSAAGGTVDFVKVLDLGVARVPTGTDHQTLTEQGKLVGTPGYMAPEMLLYGALEEPRSDLYALGVILFEMLTGEAPFSAATPIALVMKHAHEAPRHLEVAWPEVDQLVQHLLRKEPAERPADASAVMQRIAEVLALPRGETPRAVPRRMVDVNAATAPKMQTPVAATPEPAVAAAPAVALRVATVPSLPPPREASAARPAPARSRGWLAVAAAVIVAAAAGGGAVFALTRAAPPAVPSIPAVSPEERVEAKPQPAVAPPEVPAPSAPAVVEEAAAPEGAHEPRIVRPAAPRPSSTRPTPPKGDDAKPRHIPDMSP